MKLIACLLILSVIFTFWSTGSTDAKVNTASREHLVLEQFQRGRLPTTLGGRWVAWVNVIFPSRRRKKPHTKRYKKHKPGKLELLLRRLRRKARRWRRSWRRRVWSGHQTIQPSPRTPAASPVVVPLSANLVSAADSIEREETVEPETPVGPKRGRPRTIPTDHRCCPSEECPAYGELGDNPLHDIVGFGAYITTNGEVRQMYRCNVCRKPFSETAGTPFFGLKTPTHTVCTALAELSEGMGIRGVARLNHVKPDTVLEWIEKAGEHCEQVSEYMIQELKLTQVQLDELWTFVHKKQGKLSEMEKEHTEWGDNWIWIAFDPIHKLIVAVLVGDRTEEEAMGLLSRLRSRLAEGHLPLFTSDSLAHYAKAILYTFGVWIQPQRKGNRGRMPKPRPVPREGLCYATVHKERENGHVVSVTTQVVYGCMKDVMARLKPLGQKINTAYVERVNLTLRHLVSRLHRKTLCFSKKREYLEYHLHLSIAYYHFVLHHSSLRVRLPEPIPTRGNGSPKIWEKRTPAMAAGFTDHKWSMKELLMFQVPGAAC